MKILVLTNEYPPIGGGGGAHAKDLAEQHVQIGNQISVITMGHKALPNFSEVKGVKIWRTRNPKKSLGHMTVFEVFVYLLLAIPLIFQLYKQFHFDVVHAHFILPTGPLPYLLKKICGVPYIMTAHGSDIPGHSSDKVVFLHKFTRPFLRFFVRNASSVIFPSESLLKEARKAIGVFDKMIVLSHGIEVSKFGDVQVTDKKPKFFVMCRLGKLKGIDDAIEAYKLLSPKDQSKWEFIIAGAGSYESILKQKATGIPTIKFVGWLDSAGSEYIDLYKLGAVMILPSYVENMSMALIEAMLSKCAIITSDIQSCRDVVGNSAILVKPGDVRAIKGAMVRLINNVELRHDLGNQAYKLVTSKYSWESIMPKHEMLLSEAVSGGNGY